MVGQLNFLQVRAWQAYRRTVKTWRDMPCAPSDSVAVDRSRFMFVMSQLPQSARISLDFHPDTRRCHLAFIAFVWRCLSQFQSGAWGQQGLAAPLPTQEPRVSVWWWARRSTTGSCCRRPVASDRLGPKRFLGAHMFTPPAAKPCWASVIPVRHSPNIYVHVINVYIYI